MNTKNRLPFLESVRHVRLRLFSTILFAALCCFFSHQAVAQPTPGCTDPPGDLNGDGEVLVTDVVCAIIAIFAELDGDSSELACLAPSVADADVNCDGTVTVVDVLLEVGWALGIPLDTAIDGDGDQCPDACGSVLDVALTPTVVRAAKNDLHCSVDGVGEYTFDWWVNGILYEGTTLTTVASGDSISKYELAASDNWHCSATSADGGAGTSETITVKAWRPFSDDSLWNTPIVEDPELHPESETMIESLAELAGEWYMVGTKLTGNPWSVATYNATEADPIQSICFFAKEECSPDPDDPEVEICIRPFRTDITNPLEIHVPDPAYGSPDGDRMFALVEKTVEPWLNFSSWKFDDPDVPFGPVPEDITCDFKTLSSGWWDDDSDGVEKESGHWGGRATGWPYHAGLVRLEEVLTGSIDHALLVAIQYGANTCWWPAYWSDGLEDETDDVIPYGARIQLDPSVDVSTLGLTPAAEKVAVALQVYGAFLGDRNSGHPVIYAETILLSDGSCCEPVWDGVLHATDLMAIDPTHFRVLAPLDPTKTCMGEYP